MTFKKIVSTCISLLLVATLAVAMSGCEDLGAYENKEEYYSAFGDIALISGSSKVKKEYSVEDYFYNEASREDFLMGDDGSYNGVEYSDYVYMAIPFESSINMDTFRVNGTTQKSIEIKEGQYILLQIRNNSGVRVFDEDKRAFVDPQTGLELPKAYITVTNLLIRALNIKNESEVQGGE